MRSLAPLFALAVALVAQLITPRAAHAQGWPQPAAGLSMTGDPELIFTFDDGPNPATTPIVLDTLKQYGIQAIFFCTGKMVVQPRAQEVIERILAEGHIIANHTMEHGDLCRLDDARSVYEIDEGHKAIAAAVKMPIPWFRTPYGAKCPRLEAQLAERHLTHFHWDIDPQEWRHGNTKRTIDYMIRALGRTQGRQVVLMHDTKAATVKALPVILQWVAEENARREAEGRRQIRFIPASDYVIETLAPGLWKVLGELAPGPRWTSAVAAVLP